MTESDQKPDEYVESDHSFSELGSLGDIQFDDQNEFQSQISESTIKRSNNDHSNSQSHSSGEIKAKITPLFSQDSQERVKEKDLFEDLTPAKHKDSQQLIKGSDKSSINSFTTNFHTNASSRKSSKVQPKILKGLDPEVCARVEEYLKAGMAPVDIRNKLGISQRSMKILQAQFILHGHLNLSKYSRGENEEMDKEKEYAMVQQILKGLITKNCSITLRHMQKALKQNGISKSRSTIHAYLSKMRFSRKKLQKIPLERNSHNKIVYRQNYCRMIQQIPLNKQVFLDETIFGLQTAGHYGWAPKGEQPKIFVPANRRKHITLLAAISIRGFEATKIVKGPVTSKHVCEFLEHYLDHLEPDEILILDNARMHHAAVVKQKIKELNRPVRYIPAYTPQLNPIENVFSEIKAQYVRLKEDHDLKSQDMIRLIEEAIKNMRSKQFSMYYAHYEQWLKKGVAGDLVS